MRSLSESLLRETLSWISYVDQFITVTHPDVYSASLFQFIVMTYVLAVLWLLVFAFSALPVYFFYNMDVTCHTIDVLTETPASINQLCVDARQYGNKAAAGCGN